MNPFQAHLSREKCLLTALLLTAVLCAQPSVYAALDNVPSSDTAGAEQKRFEDKEKSEAQARALKKAASREEEVSEEETPAAQPGGKAFELKAIRITGNESIPESELQEEVSSWIGRRLTFSDLQIISSQLKEYYRDKRFIAAYVYLPPQKVANGVVEFRVIEGRLGQVRIEGNKWFSERVLRRALGLNQGDVIYFQDLNEGLGDLNKNPDVKARAVLKPGEQPKSTDILLKVKDKFPIHLSTEVNNLGTDNTGNTRWGVGVAHNNLLGQMDQLNTRFQLGSGAWAVGTRYSVPVGPHKTQLGFSYSRSAVDLGGDFRDLNIKGDASTYGIDILQPFWRNSFLKTALNLGFDFKSVQNKILGVKAGKDELRILNTGFNLEETDRYGKTYSPHTFHFGFSDFLGASDVHESAATRANTGGQFFIYRTSLIRYTRLPAGITHTFRADAQFTPDRLAPSEQFRLGGAFSVRGYSEGDYLADYGAFFTNEFYIPTYFFPKDWVVPYSKEQLRTAIQLVGFFDFGAGAVENALPGERKNKTLAGAGGGLRVHLFDRIYGRFQWAGRLGDRAADNVNHAFYYGISAET